MFKDFLDTPIDTVAYMGDYEAVHCFDVRYLVDTFAAHSCLYHRHLAPYLGVQEYDKQGHAFDCCKQAGFLGLHSLEGDLYGTLDFGKHDLGLKYLVFHPETRLGSLQDK